ncbi:MAG TPA: STAS domain-containing protein [Jiangellaceae bacterium]|nr:STAS domain-containing protein [Jiangellaceae bacterium]
MQQSEVPPVESSRVMVVLADDPREDTVIRLAGEHDMCSVEELTRAIVRVVDAGRSDVVFELSNVDFMDSTVIHQLVRASTRLGADGRTTRVRDPSPAARYVLDLCGLTHLVET